MFMADMARASYASRKNALKRLFGAEVAERGAAREKDIRGLEKKLERWSKNLDNYRNEHAHRYGAKALVRPRLQDLEKRIRYCGRLLNDLRILVDNSTHVMPSLKPSDHDASSRDVVDLILLGRIQDAIERWAAEPGDWHWQRRDALYKRLHRQHRGKPNKAWNE